MPDAGRAAPVLISNLLPPTPRPFISTFFFPTRSLNYRANYVNALLQWKTKPDSRPMARSDRVNDVVNLPHPSAKKSRSFLPVAAASRPRCSFLRFRQTLVSTYFFFVFDSPGCGGGGILCAGKGEHPRCSCTVVVSRLVSVRFVYRVQLAALPPPTPLINLFTRRDTRLRDARVPRRTNSSSSSGGTGIPR